MESTENKNQDMVLFVRSVFSKSEDIGALTVKQIRNAYLKEKTISILTSNEKLALKNIVRQVFLEMSDLENAKLPVSPKKGATSEITNDDKLPARKESPLKSLKQQEKQLAEENSTDTLLETANEDTKSKKVKNTGDKEENLKREESEFTVVKSRGPAKLIKTEDLSRLLSSDDPASDGIGDDELRSDDESEHTDSSSNSESELSDNKPFPSKMFPDEKFSVASRKRKLQKSPQSEELPVAKRTKKKPARMDSSSSEEDIIEKKVDTEVNPKSENKSISKETKDCSVLLSQRKFSKYMKSNNEKNLKTKKNLFNSDCEEEPVKKKPIKKQRINSDSEDELLVKPKEQPLNTDSEDESLMKPKKHQSNTDSEDEPLVKPKKHQSKTDSEDEPLVKPKRKKKVNSDSEDEPLVKHMTSTSNDDSFVGLKKKTRKGKKDRNVEVKKKSSSSENEPPKKSRKKIEERTKLKILGSCCHAAGLFIRYDRIFQDCDTDSQKEMALLSLLKEAGLKGKPTVEACKRLKVRREEKKALEDLDPANIINNSGRGSRRNVVGAFQKDKEVSQSTVKENKFVYSRLKGIVDSEESNSE